MFRSPNEYPSESPVANCESGETIILCLIANNFVCYKSYISELYKNIDTIVL